MKSWVRLLLLAVLSVAGLQLGNAEDDPLPPSLVDLVRNSPVSSFEDLKLLLQQETAALGEKEDEDEDDDDDHDVLKNHSSGRFVRSLVTVNAEEAKPAACKPRTEVMEVTRSMLDRRNADFLLLPYCVEVQRCSGCCNTRLIKCVPVRTTTRHLKVTKMQYVNKKPHFTKVIISVEDHTACNCVTVSSSPPPLTPSNLNPRPPAPQQPQTAHPARPPKTHTSKAVLHRNDDLKYNQQHHLSEEREPAVRQWPQGSVTQLVHWTQPRLPQPPTHVQSGVHQPIAEVPRSVGSWPSEAGAEISVLGSSPMVPESGGSREQGSVQGANSDGKGQDSDPARRHQQPPPHVPGVHDQELRTQYRLNGPPSDSSSTTGPPKSVLDPAHSPTPHQRNLPTVQRHSEDTSPPQTKTRDSSQKAGGEREDSGSANSGDSAGAESAGQGKESNDGHITEEARRQNLNEKVQSEQSQQGPKLPTFREVPAKSTSAPIISSAHQAPPRPALPRSRRKHRRRINKAALRAMIM